MKTLNVDLGERTYPIHIGHGLIDSDLLGSVIRGRQLLLVTDETVAPLYLERVLSNLTAFEVATVILPDGENHKNVETLDLIFSEALTRRFSRNVTMVALGGGVVGDIVGFAAATYQRGTDFLQIPTTLLSQVDSSVGGKTGVNHRLGKNMIEEGKPRLLIAIPRLMWKGVLLVPNKALYKEQRGGAFPSASSLPIVQGGCSILE